MLMILDFPKRDISVIPVDGHDPYLSSILSITAPSKTHKYSVIGRISAVSMLTIFPFLTRKSSFGIFIIVTTLTIKLEDLLLFILFSFSLFFRFFSPFVKLRIIFIFDSPHERCHKDGMVFFSSYFTRDGEIRRAPHQVIREFILTKWDTPCIMSALCKCPDSFYWLALFIKFYYCLIWVCYLAQEKR